MIVCNLCRRFAIIVGAISSTGCVSYVTVEPYTTANTQKGIPYSLAEPYLLVQPQADGTATYTWHYLPNESRKYVARPVAFLAKHTFEINIEHGMLTKATSTNDATAIASSLVTNAGAVEEAEEKAQQEAAKTQQAQLDAAAKAREDAIDAARKQVATTNSEYQTELAIQAIYEADSNTRPETLLEARIAVARAKAKLDAASAALAELTAAPVDSALNNPRGAFNSLSVPVIRDVKGPMLFRVVQADDGTATLQAVTFAGSAVQMAFPTSASASNPGNQPGTDATFKLDATNVATTNSTKLVIVANQVIDSVQAAGSTLTRAGNAVAQPTLKLELRSDKMTIDVTFGPALTAGKYRLSPAHRKTAAEGFAVTNFVEFDVSQ